MTHPLVLIEDSMIVKLIGHEVLTLITGAQVFPVMANPGVSLPYIEVSYAGGGDTNTSQRDDLDITIKVIGYSADHDQSGQIMGGIRSALHKQLLNIPGWSSYYVMEDRLIEKVRFGMDKDPMFQAVYMRGAYFEVRADKLVVNTSS